MGYRAIEFKSPENADDSSVRDSYFIIEEGTGARGYTVMAGELQFFSRMGSFPGVGNDTLTDHELFLKGPDRKVRIGNITEKLSYKTGERMYRDSDGKGRGAGYTADYCKLVSRIFKRYLEEHNARIEAFAKGRIELEEVW